MDESFRPEVGAVYNAKVTALTKFGAFVKLEQGPIGLVHISEIADKFIEDISDCLQVGQQIRVKLLVIDPQGKLSLSVKKALSETPPQPEVYRPRPAPDGFDEMLRAFRRVSDDKQLDLRRSTEAKRGAPRKRKKQ